MSSLLETTRSLIGSGAAEPTALHHNLLEPALVQAAVRRGEVNLGNGGAVLVNTGTHTGRSPNDKHFVREPGSADKLWWDNAREMTPEGFAALRDDMFKHMEGKELFVEDLYAGADAEHQLNVRVVVELAWHALFSRHMLRRPDAARLAGFIPGFTVVDLPSFKADPARHNCRSETVIAINMAEKMVLIGGSGYSGEIKKSVFTLMNYLLVDQGVMPMHCSANHALSDPDDCAVFFGLSGTGKTTLSASADRTLIGDDEHGWSDNGVFNFEGGCYAKTINLSPKAEPMIYATCSMFGSVVENMVFDEHSRALDFKDDSITQNTRVAYPLDYIPNASPSGMAGTPKHVVMLTCDAFGVLPPIARLSPAQAMYHFLSGFTAKVAGTERGVTEPEPTFSTCFGAPFMPRRPEEYGELLRKRIAKDHAECWLVNTGWSGGAYGKGERMPIKATRALLAAALEGSLSSVQFRTDPNFGFAVPVAVPGVDQALMNPRETWANHAAYDAQARKLIGMFVENFKQYEPFVGDDVKAAALKL